MQHIKMNMQMKSLYSYSRVDFLFNLALNTDWLAAVA